jgi:hypothetical protein
MSVPAPSAPPAPGQRKSEAFTVMQRMFDEGFAAGDAGVVDQLCSPDLIDHQFGLAVPDIVYTIEDFIEAGDAIWVRVRARGTVTGPFFGPPPGRPVDFTVIDIARVVGGRIVEHWGVPDRFAMLAQAGVLDRLAS